MALRFNGMSPDGSYAVADDLTKLVGQAEAEYDARLKNPRIDIWGKPLSADTPQALDAELFHPLRALTGQTDNIQRPVAVKPPETYHVGDTVVQIDPTTGQPKVLYSIPTKPVPQQFDVQKSDTEVPEVPSKTHVDPGLFGWSWGPFGTRVTDAPAIPAHKVTTTRKIPAESVLAPATNTFTNALDAGRKAIQAPVAFMGTPGGANLIPSAPAQGTVVPAPSIATTAAPVYPTATNKKTGQKIVFKDGKWQTP